MGSVRRHYDKMLGPVYSWILGDFEAAHDRNLALFEQLKLEPAGSAIAIDLGAGPGCQAIPLAERGYSVTAIDFCQALLDELLARAADLPIRTVCDDLLNFPAHAHSAELIVCMGDTLVHLPDLESVERLIGRVAAALEPGGHFVATLRDYSASALEGGDRFIPIRSSDDQIFTCFLEYADDVIHIHDLLHEKIDGAWRLTVGTYKKLALDYRHVLELLGAQDLDVHQPSTADGMVLLKARKPA